MRGYINDRTIDPPVYPSSPPLPTNEEIWEACEVIVKEFWGGNGVNLPGGSNHEDCMAERRKKGETKTRHQQDTQTTNLMVRMTNRRAPGAEEISQINEQVTDIHLRWKFRSRVRKQGISGRRCPCRCTSSS